MDKLGAEAGLTIGTPNDYLKSPEYEQRSSYKIALVEHTSENVEAIVEAIGDSPVVAVEATDMTAAQRADSLDEATKILSLNPNDPDFWTKCRDFENTFDTIERSTLVSLVLALAGTQKRMVFLDMATDDPRYAAVEAADRASEFFWSVMRQGDSSATTKAYLDRVMALVHANAVREDVMLEQIKVLGNESGGQEIAVVVGANHLPLANALAHEAPTTKIHDANEGSGMRLHDDALRLYLRLHPDGNPPDEMWQRGLLEYVEIARTNDLRASYTTAEETPADYLDRAIDDGIHAIAKRVQEIREAQSTPYDPDL